MANGTEVEETWALLDNPRLHAVGEEALVHALQSRVRIGMEQTLANLEKLLETRAVDEAG